MAGDSSEPHSLVPKYVYGLTVGLTDNCMFVNEEKIIYPASGVIVVHDTLNDSQEFVNLKKPQGRITAMDLDIKKYDTVKSHKYQG